MWSESCCEQTVPNGPWWHSKYNMCLDFFPECCSGGHYCSHNASILTCFCTTWPSRTWSTGVGMFHRPLLSAVTEVVQQEYILVGGAWLYPRVNVANTVTSPSTTVTACRFKIEGTKASLLSSIWSLLTMTNESLTLQPLSMHILYPGANEYSPWGCSIFFSGRVIISLS